MSDLIPIGNEAQWKPDPVDGVFKPYDRNGNPITAEIVNTKTVETDAPPTLADFPTPGAGGLHLDRRTDILSSVMNISGRLKILTFSS